MRSLSATLPLSCSFDSTEEVNLADVDAVKRALKSGHQRVELTRQLLVEQPELLIRHRRDLLGNTPLSLLDECHCWEAMRWRNALRSELEETILADEPALGHVYLSIGSGRLFQDAVIVQKLIDAGCTPSHVCLVDPIFDDALEGRQRQFYDFFDAQGITTSFFRSLAQYVTVLKVRPCLTADLAVLADLGHGREKMLVKEPDATTFLTKGAPFYRLCAHKQERGVYKATRLKRELTDITVQILNVRGPGGDYQEVRGEKRGRAAILRSSEQLDLAELTAAAVKKVLKRSTSHSEDRPFFL